MSFISPFPIETRILTKVIETGDFHSLAKAQITEAFFSQPENKAVFQYMKETYHNPVSLGLIPSRELILERFPSFTWAPSGDPVPILANELRTETIRIQLLKLAQDLATEASVDPIAAKATLVAKASEITGLAEVGEDLSMAASHDMLLNNYEMAQKTHGMLGIPYPWEPLNEETQGKKPGDFVVLYGRPKSKKSFIACYMACHDYLVARRRVMFFTMEMSRTLVAQRCAAMIASVDYKSFKNGQLQPELKDKTFTILKGLVEDEKMEAQHGSQPALQIISSRGAGGRAGVSWLSQKVREFKPHILYVDGLYLMKDDRSNQRSADWKAIGHVSQDLKLLGQEHDIPVIGVTQANRNAQESYGEDLTELSFSDSLGQDADAVLRVSAKERIDENGITHEEVWITAPGLREGRFEGIVIGGTPCTDFAFRRKLTNLDKAESSPKQQQQGGQKPVKPTFKSTLIDPKVAVKKL